MQVRKHSDGVGEGQESIHCLRIFTVYLLTNIGDPHDVGVSTEGHRQKLQDQDKESRGKRATLTRSLEYRKGGCGEARIVYRS